MAKMLNTNEILFSCGDACGVGTWKILLTLLLVCKQESGIDLNYLFNVQKWYWLYKTSFLMFETKWYQRRLCCSSSRRMLSSSDISDTAKLTSELSVKIVNSSGSFMWLTSTMGVLLGCGVTATCGTAQASPQEAGG